MAVPVRRLYHSRRYKVRGRRVMGMWVSKKRVDGLEKKIAGLEYEIQAQRDTLAKHLSDHEQENIELRNIIDNMKRELLYSGTAQTL